MENANIQLGSRVCASIDFLLSIGCYTGPLANASGTVVGFEQLGSQTLALIDWGNSAVPEKLNVANLALIGNNSAFCLC